MMSMQTRSSPRTGLDEAQQSQLLSRANVHHQAGCTATTHPTDTVCSAWCHILPHLDGSLTTTMHARTSLAWPTTDRRLRRHAAGAASCWCSSHPTALTTDTPTLHPTTLPLLPLPDRRGRQQSIPMAVPPALLTTAAVLLLMASALVMAPTASGRSSHHYHHTPRHSHPAASTLHTLLRVE